MNNKEATKVGRVAKRSPLPVQRGLSIVWLHVLSVTWLVAAAFAVLLPVLVHGSSFGSYDLLSQFGVLQHHGVVVHNLQAGDQSDQIIPWATLAWTQVHHGHLPLWNPYEALGMPLAFNWQTAAFSVPSLIGYLFPLHLAFTVQVVVTLVIAGAGVYVLGRVMRLGTLACVFAGTVFELSGPMLGWLGWPHAAVLSWSGWLFAASLLVVRSRHGIRFIAFLAFVIAAMIYAGQAEILVLCGLALLVFLVVFLFQRSPVMGGSGPVLRPVLDLSVGVLTGVALGAPLLLPGLQVVSDSQRAVPGGDPAEILKGNPSLPLHNLVHVIFQGFDGLPVAHSHWFGYVGGYSETAAYVGVIAVVLAVMAVVCTSTPPRSGCLRCSQRRHVGCGLCPVGGVHPVPVATGRNGAVAASDPTSHLWRSGVGRCRNGRSRERPRRTVRATLGGRRIRGGGTADGGVVGIRPGRSHGGRDHHPSGEFHLASHRDRSGPDGDRGSGLDPPALRKKRAPRGSFARQRGSSGGNVAARLRGGLSGCLRCTVVDIELDAVRPTSAVVALKGAVGSSVVGLGGSLCFFPPGLGIPENAQLAYGVQELAVYDPMIPSAYYSSWSASAMRQRVSPVTRCTAPA